MEKINFNFLPDIAIIGVGAGPVLPGPLFRRFNFARAYY